MAHFTGKQLIAFLGLFTSGYVDKDSEHDSVDDAFGCGKPRLYAIPVGRMDV
jgi:hypothetical protein